MGAWSLALGPQGLWRGDGGGDGGGDGEDGGVMESGLQMTV